jgi:hypothetical protein
MRAAALIVLHVLVGTALVVGVGVLLLWLLQRQVVGTETAAGRIRLAEAGVVVVLVLVFLLLWAWFHPIVKLAGRRRRDAFWLACVVVLALTAFLSSRKPPDATVAGLIESVSADIEAGIAALQSGYDVVLVLDPNDPGVRRLVRNARDRPSLLTSSLPAAANRDVRFGVVVVRPAQPAPRWRILQRVTADRGAVVRTIAGLPIERAGASAAASYAHAIHRAADISSKVGWRREARGQSVLLVADRLPARRELESALDVAFDRYAGSSPGFREALSRTYAGPRSWKDVLDRKRAFGFRGSDAISVSLVTTATGSPHLSAWRKWTARLGGEVLVPGGFEGARSALDVAELAAAGSPTTRRYLRLAETYRPFLLFDSQERFGVLDVDEFLRSRGADGKPLHRVCEHEWGPQSDSCRPLRSPGDLRPKDDYIDLGDPPKDELVRSSGVIYYEVVPRPTRLELKYWWFFRYNESPVWSRFNCVAGLAIAEATCFDHEGDWEGVTVTLDKTTERPRSVTYYGHGWPGYRVRWRALTKLESITGTHPHVYVAFGSHASYPTPCDLPGLKCKQFDFEKYGQVLPDGRHDGEARWYGNEQCDGCLQPLPVDGRGEPTSWNGFAGRWGAPECTRIAKMCLRSDGPRSPSKQPRTLIPARAKDLNLDFLRAFAGG